MSNKYNLDNIIYEYIEIGKLTGTSQIVNNTLNQIEEIQYFKEELKQEKEDWDGYTEPEEQIDINKYIDEVKKMNKEQEKWKLSPCDLGILNVIGKKVIEGEYKSLFIPIVLVKKTNDCNWNNII